MRTAGGQSWNWWKTERLNPIQTVRQCGVVKIIKRAFECADRKCRGDLFFDNEFILWKLFSNTYKFMLMCAFLNCNLFYKYKAKMDIYNWPLYAVKNRSTRWNSSLKVT